MVSIVLIGPRGSGKTVVGKELSSILGYPFVDADAEFTQRHGNITDFVARQGWGDFREAENRLIIDLCRKYGSHGPQRIVFAPGGGAVAHDQGEEYRLSNVKQLKDTGIIFYLLPDSDIRKSAAVLTARVQKDSSTASSRPSLSAADDLAILLQRNPLYLAASEEVVYTGSKDPKGVAEEIRDTYARLVS